MRNNKRVILNCIEICNFNTVRALVGNLKYNGNVVNKSIIFVYSFFLSYMSKDIKCY
jgi:hypothetical protein